MADVEVKKTVDKVADLLRRVSKLTECDVLVGVPQSNSSRDSGPAGNALLAYVHEFGSPARNIPPRPFLIPGIQKVRVRITKLLKQAGLDVVTGKQANPLQALKQVGMIARNSVVEEITDPNPPFTPLQPATIRARLRRTQAGRRQLRKLAQRGVRVTSWAEAGNIHPLIDTGQLRASITYVLRSNAKVVGGPPLPAAIQTQIRASMARLQSVGQRG
jgi:phage gpG-like protein